KSVGFAVLLPLLAAEEGALDWRAMPGADVARTLGIKVWEFYLSSGTNEFAKARALSEIGKEQWDAGSEAQGWRALAKLKKDTGVALEAFIDHFGEATDFKRTYVVEKTDSLWREQLPRYLKA